MSFAPFPEGSPVSRTTPTHRRSNSLEEQISSGRSKLRRTPQSDGSCRSFGEEAQAVVNTPEALVAPEAVAAAARRRASNSGADSNVMKLLAAAEDAAARDAEARAVAAARARVAAARRAAPVTPADASDGDGDDASERVSEATESEAVAGRVARRDAGVAAAARLRAEQDAQAALERQVAADREAAAREVAARRSAEPAPPPAPASVAAAPRKRSGALAARWTEAVRERESEAVVRAAGFKEEAVPSDTPVGEIFRPQQAV